MGKTTPNKRIDRFQRAADIFKKHKGILSTSEALRAGIHPETLYTLQERKTIEKLSRGLYRLTRSPVLSHPDLIVVAKKIPDGVICLISALSFYDLTTQVPHEIYVAVRRGAEEPRIDYPPIRVFRFTGKAFTEGVERYRIDRVWVRFYSPEKTLVDCFKFRNKIGLDTAIEALKCYRDQRPLRVDALMRFASICRLSRVIRPYLEVVL